MVDSTTQARFFVEKAQTVQDGINSMTFFWKRHNKCFSCLHRIRIARLPAPMKLKGTSRQNVGYLFSAEASHHPKWAWQSSSPVATTQGGEKLHISLG